MFAQTLFLIRPPLRRMLLCWLPVLTPVAAVAATGPALAGADSSAATLEEVVVRENAQVAARWGMPLGLSVLAADQISRSHQDHIHDLLVRVPGVWVSRGSGQEHLTAIRSAVPTGAGACGAFLYLENQVPIRPAGFCNINNLFEVNHEQAAAVEVLRGPGSAVYGGNALNGLINVVAPAAGAHAPRVRAEAGPWDSWRLDASAGWAWDDQALRLDVQGSDSNGYRDDTGYGQQKLNVAHAIPVGRWQFDTLLSLTNLNQETGGFVLGFEAYKDSDLKDSNPNPEAYRDAWSARLSTAASTELANGQRLLITPYLRRSRMAFLQHFAPGQPLEENGQTSVGSQLSLDGRHGDLTWQLGGALEWSDGDLSEVQMGPVLGSTAFNRAVRPAGVHYDYRVRSDMAAAFYDLRWQLREGTEVLHSLRAETLGYDYDNKASTGNLTEAGDSCGFGGCLFSRPADRDDRFSNLAGRLGLRQQLRPGLDLLVQAGLGFRPPQATELYRLRRDQQVADLDSEQLRSLEAGLRGAYSEVRWNLLAFVQRKRHVILTDSENFIVSDGRTKGHGVELELAWQVSRRQAFNLAASWAKHEYDFDRDAALGEVIQSGNEVDTAPNWLASAQWLVTPAEGRELELEVVHQGGYETNAANTADYDGHTLVNLRGRWQLRPGLALTARVLNLFDTEYADRADFAFGNDRYFPGMPLRAWVGVEVAL